MKTFSFIPKLEAASDNFPIQLPAGINKDNVKCILACNKNGTDNEPHVISCKQMSGNNWSAFGSEADKWFTSIQFIVFYS